MTRARINVAASVPETGASAVTTNVITIWDDGTSLADIESSIKTAARKAIDRARVVARITSSPPPGPPNPPRAPKDRPYA